MFIKEAVFKKLVENAFKDGTLEVGKTKGWYTINSTFWALEVRNMFLTNKIKSILIEFIG